MERLQRVIAMHGIASRRKAEDLILEGRVTVDGEVVRELGTRVDPMRQEIRVDGERLQRERRRYIMLNKPDGYITTMSDERGRRTVTELVNVSERVVPVGRLDRHTTGLLLLTNDGELLYRVTHPKFELEKEYEALLDGYPPPAVLQRLRQGVTIDGQKVVPSEIRPLRNDDVGTLLRIVIHEGRNRIVRRMLESVGYPAMKLTRTRVGPLQVRGLVPGEWRELTSGELAQLQGALHLDVEREERPRTGPARSGNRPPGPRSGPNRRPAQGRGAGTGTGTGRGERDDREGYEKRRGPSGPPRGPGDRGRRPGGGRQEHGGERRRRPD